MPLLNFGPSGIQRDRVNTWLANQTIDDDVLLRLGFDGDGVLILRSTALAANTALTGVLVGTPVTPALAANSVIIANITAAGDILLAANRGGNSEAYVHLDASLGALNLYSPLGAFLLDSAGAVTLEGGATSIFTLRAPTNTVGNDTPRIDFQGYDSASVFKTYFSIRPRIVANTAGAERGELRFYAMDSGTLANTVTIDPDGNVVMDEGTGTPLEVGAPALLNVARGDGGTSNCLALGNRTVPSVNGHQTNVPVYMLDSLGALIKVADMVWEILDRTQASMDVSWRLRTIVGGTLTNRILIDTNLRLNVPTGGTHEFAVNNTLEAVLSATALDLQGNNLDNVAVLISNATNPASAGVLRLGNTEAINWRNAANSADLGNMRVTGGNVLAWDVNTTLDITRFYITRSNSGGVVDSIVENIANAAGSDAVLNASVTGASGGDPKARFDAGGATTWVMGIDNSSSDLFAISNSNALGTNDAIRVTAATPPVITYNTTHPTGTFDYVCQSCFKHGPEPFTCCGMVIWQDDMAVLSPVLERQPGALEYMTKLGVFEISQDNDGKPWIGMAPVMAHWFTWSAMRQMDNRIKELERLVGV